VAASAQHVVDHITDAQVFVKQDASHARTRRAPEPRVSSSLNPDQQILSVSLRLINALSELFPCANRAPRRRPYHGRASFREAKRAACENAAHGQRERLSFVGGLGVRNITGVGCGRVRARKRRNEGNDLLGEE